jgi:hypothetical protein
MSSFSSSFENEREVPIRETLFGDMPIDLWPRDAATAESFPWSKFVSARSHLAAGRKSDAIADWRQVLQHPGLEPRHYLQAWHFLRQQGEQLSPDIAKQVLGVVIEVAMPQGLDLLAAYPDHSARYYNYSGAGVVWEHPDASLDGPIDQLLEVAEKVVAVIGPWEEPRPEPPPTDQVRMSFLTPSGLHFGQGAMDVMSRDPLGGRVIHAATVLMTSLIAKSNTG